MNTRTASFTDHRLVAWRWSQALREPARRRLRMGFMSSFQRGDTAANDRRDYQSGAATAAGPSSEACCSRTPASDVAGIAPGVQAPCAAVNVSELDTRADGARVARWDAFVSERQEATFFHRAAWRSVLRDAFGQRAYFLYAESGGQIRGVLPLARQKSILFGDALISTPFCVYGGVAADGPEARAALEEAAIALGERLGVAHIEFRNREPDRKSVV